LCKNFHFFLYFFVVFSGVAENYWEYRIPMHQLDSLSHQKKTEVENRSIFTAPKGDEIKNKIKYT